MERGPSRASEVVIHAAQLAAPRGIWWVPPGAGWAPRGSVDTYSDRERVGTRPYDESWRWGPVGTRGPACTPRVQQTHLGLGLLDRGFGAQGLEGPVVPPQWDRRGGTPRGQSKPISRGSSWLLRAEWPPLGAWRVLCEQAATFPLIHSFVPSLVLQTGPGVGAGTRPVGTGRQHALHGCGDCRAAPGCQGGGCTSRQGEWVRG